MDWLAAAFILTGIWLVGNRNRNGFLVCLVGCACWLVVAQSTGVHGLYLEVIPAVLINIRNYRKWGLDKEVKNDNQGRAI